MFLNSVKRLTIEFLLEIKSIKHIRQLLIHRELDRLKQDKKYQQAKHLTPFGYKIYSQNDEDGIIREIFNRIGTTNKVFVEFGIGNGLENNTLALLFDNWQGVWIEGSAKAVKEIQKQFTAIIQSNSLKVIHAFITRDNIDSLIKSSTNEKEVDLLSVDLDGNDYHILSAIKCINPRVIVIEYNAKFVPPIKYCMDYNENHSWNYNDCFGVSLKFLEVHLKEKGYELVGCNIVGLNAFFVRKELIGEHFLAPYTAENHYEPARYYLAGFTSGHKAAYSTLANKLTDSM